MKRPICFVGALGRTLNVQGVRLACSHRAPPRIWTFLSSLDAKLTPLYTGPYHDAAMTRPQRGQSVSVTIDRPRVRRRRCRPGGRLRRLRPGRRPGRSPSRPARPGTSPLRSRHDRGHREPVAPPGRGPVPILRALRRLPVAARRLPGASCRSSPSRSPTPSSVWGARPVGVPTHRAPRRRTAIGTRWSLPSRARRDGAARDSGTSRGGALRLGPRRRAVPAPVRRHERAARRGAALPEGERAQRVGAGLE